MEQGAASSRAHIVAIPYALIGHMIPMIQLCKLLIAVGGCRVTMVITERDLASLLKLLPKDYEKQHIRAIGISDGLPFDVRPDWDTGRAFLHAHHERNGGMARSFERLLPNLHDVVCVISDLHLRWTQEAASRLGVPRIALWVSAAAALHVFNEAEELIQLRKLPFKAPKGKKYEEKGICNMIPQFIGRPPVYHVVDLEDRSYNEEKIYLPGLPRLHRRDFPTFLQIEDPLDIFFHTWIDNARSCHEASMVIINSFDVLERTIITLLKSSGIPAHTIGPLSLLEDVVLKDQANPLNEHKHGNAEQENCGLSSVVENHKVDKCLNWLEKQNAWSVLYVAFGTTVELTKAQTNEIALGLKASEQPFIWVLPHHEDKELPKEFLEHVEHKGFLLNWAPQDQILQHSSIGAFLSHCGWNSTMEAICSGVPLICLPFYNDQTLQCSLLVEDWKVALRLERSFNDGIALATNVSLLTQEILLKETGSLLRKRAQQFMIAAKNSVQVEGSSRLTLDAILKMINHNSFEK